MSIFGTDFPKFIYKYGLQGETAVLLPFAVITKNEPTTNYAENVSQVDGTKESHKRGTHQSIEMQYFLYKEIDPLLKYKSLSYFKGKHVKFWLHRDADPFMTAVSTLADFVLTEVTPYYVSTVNLEDGVLLVFESLETIL